MGKRFVTPTLDEFVTAWVQMFSHSPKSRLLWQNRVGKSVKNLSKTCWWSRWEVINQLLELFGDVGPFLMEYEDIGPRTRTRMLSILQDPSRKAYLVVEMAVVVDADRELVKTTYKIEGDGSLVLQCYDRVQAIFVSIHVKHYPNVDAVITRLIPRTAVALHNWKVYAQSCSSTGLGVFCKEIYKQFKQATQCFQSC